MRTLRPPEQPPERDGTPRPRAPRIHPTTTYTYDAQDNVLSTTDPLNNKTSTPTTRRKQVLTTKDARGKTTTNEYDAKGNLLKTKDALDHITDVQLRHARATS